QFANILSFTRFRGYLKNTSNIIAWTSVDESQHANAGIFIINKLREEGYINQAVVDQIRHSVGDYIEVEKELLDWIYENGELDFFTKEDMLNFMKYRVDEALAKMQVEKVYNIPFDKYRPMKWFEEDVFANELDDFFAKRPTAYTKHDKSISANDLF
ncbi:MAG TPA: ribonucleotide-diphosphate reductase subunit beta, partial [Chitinophagaceae bacterium]|nr:ribonucleotide-diphosphate reductase subunit beta [Chitinophagaceae bacterium]